MSHITHNINLAGPVKRTNKTTSGEVNINITSKTNSHSLGIRTNNQDNTVQQTFSSRDKQVPMEELQNKQELPLPWSLNKTRNTP